MKHAASISKEDEEEEQHHASKHPFMNEDENKFSPLDPFKQLGVYLFMQVLRFLSYLTPSNLKKQVNSMKEKTIAELIIGFFKLIINTFIFSSSFIYSIVRYCLRILLRLMSGEALAGNQIKQEEEQTVDTKAKLALPSPYVNVPPATTSANTSSSLINGTQQDQTTNITVKVTPAADQSNKPLSETDKSEETKESSTSESGRASISNQDSNKLNAETKHDAKSTSKTNLSKESSAKHSSSAASSSSNQKQQQQQQQQLASAYEELSIENKGDQAPPVIKAFGRINISGYTLRFICFLARNFYSFKNIALFIAFFINFILLFYKISTNQDDANDELITGDLIQNLTESNEDFVDTIIDVVSAEDSSGEDGSEEDSSSEEYASIQENLRYLSPFLRFLAVSHSLLSLCLLIGYYHLKLPLAIFKREKEISRAMEFDGLYIEQNTENMSGRWDKIVVSTPSFPVLYWDKFVKKRVREKYSEQFDYDSITKILGMTNDSLSCESSKENLPFWHKIDFKYLVWKAGVTITDKDFLYNFFYLFFSLLGNVNYFFFAAHLIDIAFVVKSLRTILQSVTHNGRQLMLTVILLVIVVCEFSFLLC